MLFKACIIVLAISVSVWADKCPGIHEECKPEDIPTDYPETVEELIRDCNIIKELGRCLIAFYVKNCPGNEDAIGEIEKLLNYVEAECQEDSHNFQVISENIDCVAPAARSLNEACSWEGISDEEFEKAIALLQPLWDKGFFQCSSAVEKIVCYSHVISKRCGTELKDVVTNILENTLGSYTQCNEEHLKELVPFMEYYEALLIKQDMFENTSTDEE